MTQNNANADRRPKKEHRTQSRWGVMRDAKRHRLSIQDFHKYFR